MCASLRPSLRLILNAAGVQFTPLSILQTHALDREHRRPSLRRIDRRTPLPDRGGRCRDRPLARLHRADSWGPHRPDALLRTNARRSRETAAPVVDARARTASGGNRQGRSPHVLTRGATRRTRRGKDNSPGHEWDGVRSEQCSAGPRIGIECPGGFFEGHASSSMDKERICAIRTILRKIDRSTRPADW
jgi:hypothetical protein